MTITYSTATAVPAVTNMDSAVAGAAYAFGEINRAGELSNSYQITIPLAATASGTVSVYLAESDDGAEWVDGIDPGAAAANIAASIQNVKILKTFTADQTVNDPLVLSILVPATNTAKYVGLIVKNDTSLAFGTGCSGNYINQSIA